MFSLQTVSQRINTFLLTDATLPGRTILTGTWVYGLGPASMVDPHPAMSPYMVGWNYAGMSEEVQRYRADTNRGQSNI
jgi:hypothetical protein